MRKKKASFVLDLAPTFKEMGHPPSVDAKIVLKPNLKYKNIRVELP